MTDTVQLTMPAKAEYLILARLALAGIAREIPMSESALADLKLAVTEVCGNAVRHAYGDEGAGPGLVVVRENHRLAPVGRRGDAGNRLAHRPDPDQQNSHLGSPEQACSNEGHASARQDLECRRLPIRWANGVAFVVVGGPGAILARIRCAPHAVDGLRLRALAACERTVSTTGRMDR